MSKHEFPIPVVDLDAGGKAFDFPVRAEWVRGLLESHEATTTGRDGQIKVRASALGGEVVVHGTLSTSVICPCARCTDPFELPVDIELSALFTPAAKYKKLVGEAAERAAAKHKGKAPKDGPEIELSSADADTLPYEGETVALDDLVRDEILLEIPMIPLCSDDCPGMSARPAASADPGPSAGAPSPPIDPRLAPLLAFRAVDAKKPN